MLTWSPWRKQSWVSTSVTDGCSKILVPFSISDLEHINLQNTSQTRVCTLDIEKNGNLFFHGYEIDPDMEYLYASECHIDNKYCCIIRTEIQYFVFSEWYGSTGTWKVSNYENLLPGLAKASKVWPNTAA